MNDQTKLHHYVEAREADIIKAVLKLADRFGIKGITTKRIAGEVGFVEAALYKHYRSKSAIFEMILDVYEKILSEKSRELDSAALSPDRYLAEWMGFAVSYLEELPGVYRVLFSDELYVEKKELFFKFKDLTLELCRKFEAIISQGMVQGIFRRDIQPELMATLYLGVIHTSFTFWNIFIERSRPYHEIALPLFQEFLKSIAIPKEPRP